MKCVFCLSAEAASQGTRGGRGQTKQPNPHKAGTQSLSWNRVHLSSRNLCLQRSRTSPKVHEKQTVAWTENQRETDFSLLSPKEKKMNANVNLKSF